MNEITPRDAYLRLRILSRCLVGGPCDESMVRELSRYDTVGLARRPKFRRSRNFFYDLSPHPGALLVPPVGF